MNGETRQTQEMLARDYVLGLLGPEETTSIEAALAENTVLAADVRYLRARLQELDFAAPAEPVSDGLWPAIEGRITDKVVSLDAHRPADDDRAWRGGYWKGFVSAALVASLAFAIASMTVLRSWLTPPPVVVAVLVDEQGNADVIVEALEEDRVRVVPLVDIPVPEGKALEVWTLIDPAEGPISLGLLETSDAADLGGFDLPTPNADQLYEISLEPETGSPVGRPTGPVLYKGLAKVPR